MQTLPACEEERGCPLEQHPVSTGFQPLVQAAATLSTKRWPRRGVLVKGPAVIDVAVRLNLGEAFMFFFWIRLLSSQQQDENT